LGNYKIAEPIGSFTADAMAKGFSTPSHYDSIDTSVYKERIPFTKICKPIVENSTTVRGLKVTKDPINGIGKPAPTDY